MIDDFALGLCQFLILVTLWRLTRRRDLDADLGAGPQPPANDVAGHAAAPAGVPGAPQLVPSLFGAAPFQEARP